MIAGEYPPAIGGVADYSACLVDALRLEGSAVTVVTTWPESADPDRFILRGWDPREIERLVHWMRESRPDVIHLQYQTAAYGMSPLINLLPWLIRGRGIRQPFFTTFHDLRAPFLFPKAGPLRRQANRALARASAGVIYANPADLLADGGNTARAWIPLAPSVRPAVPTTRSRARQSLAIPDNDVVVAFFGFVNASKGLDDLIRAVGNLAATGMPIRLLLIGEALGTADPTNQSTAAAIAQLAKALRIEDRIVATGRVDPPQVSAAFAAADVCVLPFRDGAAPNRSSLLAALAHGVPVITTTPQGPTWIGDMLPPFDHLHTGAISPDTVELVTPGHVAGLASAITGLVADAPRQAQLRAAGLQYVAPLTWSNVARATMHFYRHAKPPP